jgi:hypothetical protein
MFTREEEFFSLLEPEIEGERDSEGGREKKRTSYSIETERCTERERELRERETYLDATQKQRERRETERVSRENGEARCVNCEG